MVSILAVRQTVAARLTLAQIVASSRPMKSFSTTCRRSEDDNSGPAMAFRNMPSPPRLPKEEQEIFEQLQRRSTGAFSTSQSSSKINQFPESGENHLAGASSSGEEPKHRDFQGRLKPEFEGETNPKTGEVGGPKNEPLRWGAEGDWSYGSRVTDF